MKGRDRTPPQRVARLALITVVAMVGAFMALRSFPPPPRLVCPADAPGDATFDARLDPRPRSGTHDYDLSLSHHEFKLSGFQLCLRVAMDGMPEMRVTAQPAMLGSPERLTINFEMAGSWSGEVILVRHDHPGVAVPIRFEVG